MRLIFGHWSYSKCRRVAAFTLVELLVVISIISLLIALLLPALARAWQQGQSVACLSNLRQLGIAANMYGNQYENFVPGWDYGNANYPDTNDWTELLAPMLEQKWVFWALPGDIVHGAKYTGNNVPVYQCPSAVADLTLGNQFWIPRHPTTYVISFFASDPILSSDPDAGYAANHYWMNYGWTRFNQWPDPTNFPLIMDGFQVSEPTPNGAAWGFYADPSTVNSIGTSVSFRHGGGSPFDANNGSRAVNVSFLDGHAQTMLYGDFMSDFPSPANKTLPGGVTFNRP